jgi:hypothetical protein
MDGGTLKHYTDSKAADVVCLYTQAKFGSKELNIQVFGDVLLAGPSSQLIVLVGTTRKGQHQVSTISILNLL